MSSNVIVWVEPHNAELTRTLIERNGHTVVFAPDAESVAALALAHQAWLIVLAESVFAPSDIPQLRAQLANDKTLFLTLDKPRRQEGDGNMRGYSYEEGIHLDTPYNPMELRMWVHRMRRHWESTTSSKDGRSRE